MNPESTPRLNRRDWLKGLGSLSAAAIVAGCASPARRSGDLIRRENAQPGTRDWLLQKPRIDPTTKYRCPWVEGYCSHTTVRAGEALDIFVSTNPASEFTLDIYRTGFYGGTGGRHVLSLGPLPGRVQPDPPIGKNRLRECRWEPSATLKIPRDWVSGVTSANSPHCAKAGKVM